MPTTKRARRHSRNNEHQRQFLLYGDILAPTFNEPVFASAEEERRAWYLLRDELMRECRAHFGPGRRPAGFYQYELGCAPQWRWYEEIAVLLERNLIDAVEAAGIEATHKALSPGQGDSFCSGFDDPARIVQMRLDEYMRRSLAQEFIVVADWHTWRGRPELAATYRARAECVRGVEAGTA